MHRFDKLLFDDFKKLAKDSSLSVYEKIGFDNEYREQYEHLIFSDILRYAYPLLGTGKRVLDIGPGCTELPKRIIKHCYSYTHHITLIDSQEMLDLLPTEYNYINTIAGMFPEVDVKHLVGLVDVIIIYSVLQHVFFSMNPYVFLDKAVSLLAPEGVLFLGDIPNVSKRLRSKKIPLSIEKESMDDGFIISILNRYRNFGYETYLVPHNTNLPLKDTRDNILIVRGGK